VEILTERWNVEGVDRIILKLLLGEYTAELGIVYNCLRYVCRLTAAENLSF
jgi:hypothetical protein